MIQSHYSNAVTWKNSRAESGANYNRKMGGNSMGDDGLLVHYVPIFHIDPWWRK
jgi:hypothetical protein